MRRRSIILLASLAIIAGICYMARYLRYRYIQDHESCANCRSFIDSALEQYLMKKEDGWLPRGGHTPADSLTQLSSWLHRGGADNFTSHAMAGKHCEYYKKHRSFNYDFMCYRYNEGIHKDDPKNLIVMYYFKPTRWECSVHKEAVLGRPVLELALHGWNFLPEAEFQRRQKRTEDYLKENNRITTASTVLSEGAPSDGQ